MNKMKCKITYGNTQFVSRYLDPPKPEKVNLQKCSSFDHKVCAST